MTAIQLGLTLLAAVNEEFIPPTDWRARIALPAGILIFFGSVYLLLRSNLGTRRAYLVEASAFFAFMLVYSLFWLTGAPGTPRYTGPQNLPGQSQDYYVTKWVPFAPDSLLADREFEAVKSFPEGFGAVPEDFQERADEGAGDIQEFFAVERNSVQLVGEDWEVQEIAYNPNVGGDPVIAVTMAAPEGEETYTAFAYFDAGAPWIPSVVFVVLSLIGFVLHTALLAWDENQERRAAEAEQAEEPEKVPAAV